MAKKGKSGESGMAVERSVIVDVIPLALGGTVRVNSTSTRGSSDKSRIDLTPVLMDLLLLYRYCQPSMETEEEDTYRAIRLPKYKEGEPSPRERVRIN